MLDLFYQALSSKRGVCVRVENGTRDQLRQKLYRLAAEAADPELKKIAIQFSPSTEDELWLVRKEPEA